jgi:hypothetical protein
LLKRRRIRDGSDQLGQPWQIHRTRATDRSAESGRVKPSPGFAAGGFEGTVSGAGARQTPLGEAQGAGVKALGTLDAVACGAERQLSR